MRPSVAKIGSRGKVKLNEKLAPCDELWQRRIAGELNGRQVKLVNFVVPLVGRHHEARDDLFLAVPGLRLELRDRSERVEAGVPMFEPCTTLNTGRVPGPMTEPVPERI